MMKTTLHITLILGCLAFCSCNRNPHNTYGIQQTLDSIATCGLQDFHTLPIDVMSVDNILIQDSILWICSEDDGQNLIHAYNFQGEPISKGIGIGQGGNDVLEITSMHPTGTNGIELYDARSGKIMRLGINGNNLDIQTPVEEIRMLDDAFILDGNTILALPVNSDKSYEIRDNNGTVTYSISYFPPTPDGIDKVTHHLACTGMAAFSPSDSMLVRSIVYDGALSFFKIAGGKIDAINRFSLFDMEYGTLNGDGKIPVPNEASKTGYAHVYATPRFFYASYSDKKVFENPEGLATEIHVFNHDGTPVRRLLLPTPAGAFAVDSADRFIYTPAEEEDATEIRIYTLPSGSV